MSTPEHLTETAPDIRAQYGIDTATVREAAMTAFKEGYAGQPLDAVDIGLCNTQTELGLATFDYLAGISPTPPDNPDLWHDWAAVRDSQYTDYACLYHAFTCPSMVIRMRRSPSLPPIARANNCASLARQANSGRAAARLG